MRLPTLKPGRVVKVLAKLGFYKLRQSGSHLIMFHRITKKLVPVLLHNKDMKRGLLRNIIKQTGLSVQDFMKIL